MNKQEVMDKVYKLDKLAERPGTPEEGQTAANFANHLCEKYGITRTERTEYASRQDRANGPRRSNMDDWFKRYEERNRRERANGYDWYKGYNQSEESKRRAQDKARDPREEREARQRAKADEERKAREENNRREQNGWYDKNNQYTEGKCRNGHDWSTNARYDTRGARVCSACRSESSARSRAKRANSAN